MSQLTIPRRHRDLPPIPTDSAARTAELKWLLAHKIWTYPTTLRVPPPGAELFTACPDGTSRLAPDTDWPEEPYDDGHWSQCVDISVVYVDPTTECIADESRNTAFRIWLAAGPWSDQAASNAPAPPGGWTPDNRWLRSHDWNLNCRGPDLETALLELARLVRFFYGDGRDDRPGAPVRCPAHRDAGDGFCAVCGFHIQDVGYFIKQENFQ